MGMHSQAVLSLNLLPAPLKLGMNKLHYIKSQKVKMENFVAGLKNICAEPRKGLIHKPPQHDS